jgi:hypothetical protein
MNSELEFPADRDADKGRSHKHVYDKLLAVICMTLISLSVIGVSILTELIHGTAPIT